MAKRRAISSERRDTGLRSSALALAADVHINNHPKIRPVLAKVKPAYVEADVPAVTSMSAERRANFDYFRNWVAPELTKSNREDEFACLGCRGVAGRVPSMPLQPADDNGYLSAKATYANYVSFQSVLMRWVSSRVSCCGNR